MWGGLHIRSEVVVLFSNNLQLLVGLPPLDAKRRFWLDWQQSQAGVLQSSNLGVWLTFHQSGGSASTFGVPACASVPVLCSPRMFGDGLES